MAFILLQTQSFAPKVRPVNLKCVQAYQAKFEESLRNLEKLQQES
ncbi:MAG: hypothetical protein ACXIT9_13105 [Nitritalea sp.]